MKEFKYCVMFYSLVNNYAVTLLNTLKVYTYVQRDS